MLRVSVELIVETVASRSPSRVEVVERKGLGHPDTLCDAIAERVCVRLCRFYLETFGVILHHNVDKILLCGGASRPAFGGGVLTAPIEVYLAGRVTKEYRGASVPIDEIAVSACREVLRETLPELDVMRDVTVFPRFRPGSDDLSSLFVRSSPVPLANDSSCAAGFAPLTELERVVLSVEHHLNAPEARRLHPEIGADIKVLGVRIDDRIALTVGCAFVGRHLVGLEDYVQKKIALRDRVDEAARKVTRLAVRTAINAADDVEGGKIFLTVTGTSAEAGDDGEVGRGNRSSGLITPYRWMTLEAAAGKNPVSHVGKLYNVLAGRIATRMTSEVPGVRDAACLLVSAIGRPVDDPQMVHVQASVDAPGQLARASVEDVIRAELAGVVELREIILAGQVGLF